MDSLSAIARSRRWLLAGQLLLALALAGCMVTPMPDDALTPASDEPFVPSRFALPEDTRIIGRLHYTTVRGEQTLLDIARAYDLGYDDIIAANPGVDPWTPAAGERVLLPLAHVLPDAPREGIVINLAARRLFYFLPAVQGAPREVVTHPIGIGREGWATPLGSTRVAKKHDGPSWTVPASILREHAAKGDPLPAVVPPGPDNPLGSHALRLGWSSILIHGTNKPAGIGMRVSHGCIQLYPEDIAPLFAAVPEGTPVRVVDQPYLAGLGSDGLLFEAHAPTTGSGAKAQARVALERALKERQAEVTVDWELVRTLAAERGGYPLPVAADAADREAYLAGLPEAQPLDPPPLALPAAGEWFVDLGRFEYERSARKLVAMLRYQGPAIPALRLARDGEFQVLAGPWATRTEAEATAKRIARDLEEDGAVVRLTETELSARL